MKFEKTGNIKKGLRIGKYENSLEVTGLIHTIKGGQYTEYLLPTGHLWHFLKCLERGTLPIPSDLTLKDKTTLREEYKLRIRCKDGNYWDYTANMPGEILEMNGEIFEVANELVRKKIKYEY